MELVRYFLRLGLLGFGGPVALVGQMEREVVTEKGWLSRADARGNRDLPRSGRFWGPCVLLARIAIAERLTAGIGVVSLAALFRWKRSNPLLIAAAATAGLIAFPWLQPGWIMVK